MKVNENATPYIVLSQASLPLKRKYYHNHYHDLITCDRLLTSSQKSAYKFLTGLSHTKRSDKVSIAKSLISKKICYDKRTIDTAVNKLLELGYINLLKKGGRDGKTYNTYRVNFDPSQHYIDESKYMRRKQKIPLSKLLAKSISNLVTVGVDRALLYKLVREAKIKTAILGVKEGSLEHRKLIKKLETYATV